VVKIIGRKSLGMQSVYDIGVERDHNFILNNNKVASNCFNKSHSTAYGYVTYQTAYLKANYPVEYMAALLTASSGTQEKVQKYIATCSSMAITVQQPDINRSELDFTPVEQTILFGLSAVRNLGQGAIECILKAREVRPFKTVADLCDRVDMRAVNRRALEALIHCGAFDSLQPNRKQLIEYLDIVIGWAQSRAKERDSLQYNLFDLSGSNKNGSTNNSAAAWESAPLLPNVKDFSPQEKLRLEKELLGFYVSDHPLKLSNKIAKVLSPINIAELGEQNKRTIVSAIVMLTEVKPHLTKKDNKRMAFLQIEDLTGQAEAVIFPKAYEKIESLITTDARLIVWGKVDKKDDQVQLIIEDAELIEEAQMVVVELTPPQANDSGHNQRLKSILQGQSGDKKQARIPVLATVPASLHRQFVRFDSKYWVQDCTTAVNALKAAGFSARPSSLTGS
jgi:DNA polymerase III subunit alpha